VLHLLDTKSGKEKIESSLPAGVISSLHFPRKANVAGDRPGRGANAHQRPRTRSDLAKKEARALDGGASSGGPRSQALRGAES